MTGNVTGKWNEKCDGICATICDGKCISMGSVKGYVTGNVLVIIISIDAVPFEMGLQR